MNADSFERYGRWIATHRVAASLLIIFITIASTFGIVHRVQQGVPIDFTPQAMFMSEGGMWERLQNYEEEFGVEDNTMVVLVEGPVNSTEGVEFLQALHDAVEARPRIKKVQSLVNASIVESDESGMLLLRDAINDGDAPLTDAAKDPFLGTFLISPDQQVVTLQIHLDDDLDKIADIAPVINDLKEQVRAVAVPTGFKVHTTGIPYVRAEVVDMMLIDEMTFFPAVGVIFLVTICTLFRRILLGVIPMVGVFIATVWSMGALLSSGAVLNILSILTPTLVLVIGVADGIHMVSRYREELYKDQDRAAALGRTLRSMALACFLTSFTTAVGFASLIVAETQVIQDFGIHVAVSVLITFSTVLLAVPTLLAWLPISKVGKPHKGGNRPEYKWLSNLVATAPKRVLFVGLLFTVFAGYLGRDVRTNSALLEMYHEGHPTWESVQVAEEKVGGVIPLFLHLSGDEGQMLEPDILERVAQLENEISSQAMVGWTMSAAGWVRHFHSLLTDEEGLPSSREAVAQELLLAEMSGELPLDRILSHDRARTRILVLAKDFGGRETLKVKHHLESVGAEIFADTGITLDVTGDGMLAAHSVENLIQDLIASLGLVLIVILFTMFALLRDVRQTLIATAPNLIPLVFILGTMGLMGVDLQTSNIVSFTVAVGLAVDDTIHFIVRYREEHRRCPDITTAIHNTLQGAGHPIVLTSILLVLGFGVLAFSSLTSTYFFGILACVTMIAALLGDLFLLPATLHLFDKQSHR